MKVPSVFVFFVFSVVGLFIRKVEPAASDFGYTCSMRSHVVGLLVVALAVVVAAPSNADVGPRPSCPDGEHHEYLYGHHCVPNGSHLERDESGHPVAVPNGARPTPKPRPAPTPTPTPTPPPSDAPSFAEPPPAVPSVAPPAAPAPTPEPVVAPSATLTAPMPGPSPSTVETPPGKRGVGCDVVGRTAGSLAFALVPLLASLLFARRRR